MFDIVFISIVTVFDIAGAVIIAAGMLRDKWRLFPVWHRVGLVFAAIGLTAQAGRNISFLITGVSAQDTDLPLWAFKDLAIATVAITYFVIAIRERQAQPAKVKAATKPKKGAARGRPAKSR